MPRHRARASSLVKKKPCWWRPPARAHRQAATDARSNCWLCACQDDSTRETVTRNHAPTINREPSQTVTQTYVMHSPIHTDYVTLIQHMLHLYTKRPTQTPIICFDESPIQLIGKCACPSQPNQNNLALDHEYPHNNTTNLFIFLHINHPSHKIKITQHTLRKISPHTYTPHHIHYPTTKHIP